MGVRPSMGTVGDAYDNAMAESFFASLECELIDRRSWQTKTEARLALFTYIEGLVQPAAPALAHGQTSPANFERNHVNPIRSQHGLPTAGAASQAARRRWTTLHLSSSVRLEIKSQPVRAAGSTPTPFRR